MSCCESVPSESWRGVITTGRLLDSLERGQSPGLSPRLSTMAHKDDGGLTGALFACCSVRGCMSILRTSTRNSVGHRHLTNVSSLVLMKWSRLCTRLTCDAVLVYPSTDISRSLRTVLYIPGTALTKCVARVCRELMIITPDTVTGVGDH